MFLTAKPSKLWVRIDACHFGNQRYPYWLSVTLTNTHQHLSALREVNFFKTVKPTVYQALTHSPQADRSEFLSSKGMFYLIFLHMFLLIF